FRNAVSLIDLSHHETYDVVNEEERNASSVAQLDEVRALLRALAEHDPIVGDDTNRLAADFGKATNQGLTVKGLEWVEAAVVDQAGEDLEHWQPLARIGRDDSVQLLR